MNDLTETVVSTVNSSPERRIVIALRPRDPLPIVLRTESFSSDVGWFEQQLIQLSRSELQGLRNLLGVHVHKACEQALASVDARDIDTPQVISIESARQKTA
jgi:hypothetical protein